jgi:formylglycine-generating enzyme required for sulfatase activity
MMLIVGAGSAALYVKFFYFPSRQTALIENLPKTLEKLSAGVELPDGGTDAIADVTPERKALAMIPSQPDHLGTQAFPTPDAGDVSKLPKTVPPDAGTADIPEEKPQPPPKVKVAKVEPPKLKEPVIKVKQPIQPKPIARKKVPQKRPIERKVKVATLTPVEPKPKPSRAPTSNRCPRDMAYIAAGSFQMGSAEDDNMRGFGELTLAWRKTEAYCIDRYEYPGRGKMPRVGVNFYQAQKICEEQNKRLCTEIEWERACKGGQNYRYPYGNNFSAYACNTQAGGGQSRSLVPTSSFSKCRNRYGIYDMSGNAAEWTLSHFRPNGPTRTIRGGAANRPDWDVRCASRAALAPSSGRNLLGFRCCAEPK